MSIFSRFFKRNRAPMKTKGQRVQFGQLINDQEFKWNYTGTNAAKAYAENDMAYAVIRTIITQAAKMEIKLMEAKSPRAKAQAKHYPLHEINRKHQNLEEIEDHPLLKRWNDPNRNESKGEFLTKLFSWYLMDGETFRHRPCAERGPNRGIATEWKVVPPSTVQKITHDKWGDPVTYHLEFKSYKRDVKAPEMSHMMMFNPDIESGRGMSPLQPGGSVVAAANGYSKASSMLLNNGGPRGIIYSEDGFTSNEEENAGSAMTQDQVDDMEERFHAKTFGSQMYNRLVWLGQKVGFIPVGSTAKEMSLDTTGIEILRRFCNIYQIPSEVMNDAANKTFANRQEASAELIRKAVVPLCQTFVDEIQRTDIRQAEEAEDMQMVATLDLTVWPELAADKDKEAERLERSWWIAPNRKLEIQGEETINNPMFDVPWVPVGLQPLTGSASENAAKLLKLVVNE